MAERLFQVHLHGIVGFETHLSPDDSVEVEESMSLITVNIRSGSRPVSTSFTPVNEADGTVGAPSSVTVMEPVGEGTGAAGAPAAVGGVGTVTNPEGPDLLTSPEEITVEELKGLLRDKDLPVSGTKAELIARLNENR